MNTNIIGVKIPKEKEQELIFIIKNILGFFFYDIVNNRE